MSLDPYTNFTLTIFLPNVASPLSKFSISRSFSILFGVVHPPYSHTNKLRVQNIRRLGAVIFFPQNYHRVYLHRRNLREWDVFINEMWMSGSKMKVFLSLPCHSLYRPCCLSWAKPSTQKDVQKLQALFTVLWRI